MQLSNRPVPLYPDAWIGRPILPTADQRISQGEILFEIKQAPAGEDADQWVGKTVRLAWSDAPKIAPLDHVTFDKQTLKSKQQSNVHPDRLEGWTGISPLESLAGGHNQDDLLVKLPANTALQLDQGRLLIHDAPVEVAGTHGLLIDVEQADGQHLRLSNHKVLDTTLSERRYDASKIEGSYLATGNLGEQGFELAALRTPDLLLNQSTSNKTDRKDCIEYVKRGAWAQTSAKANQVERVLLNPLGADNPFKPGEKYLVLHLYGEVRGLHGDAERPLGVVPGHFAYGTAKVHDNPVTNSAEFDIEYRQIYAHGPQGVLSGAQDWDAYMGDVSSGVYANRPNCDLVVRHPALQKEHQIAGHSFSFFDALEEEASRMEARYRTGDGDGLAKVTASNSCTQDSAQAMFSVLHRLDSMAKDSGVREFLNSHPDDLASKDFEAMVGLGESMREVLTPVFGLAPSRWQANADGINGKVPAGGFLSQMAAALVSWRTVLPRKHHEAMAEALLKNDAQMMAVVTHGMAFPKDSNPVSPNYPFSNNYRS